MKNLILISLFFISFFSMSQTCPTTIAYDNVEDYNWTGVWWGFTLYDGYFNDVSVSPDFSAAIYGSSAATGAEEDYYVLPNVAGLNTSYTYQFKMRLGSYTFSNPSAASRGTDLGDFVEIQASTNGEISYTSEIRITGNNNATWNYNTAGVINKTANGTLTTYAPAAGGDRTATGDGYSDITLIFTGISQLAIDIYCKVNSNGEEWWLDNMQLIEIAPCNPLAVELLYFKGEKFKNFNKLKWATASEINSDYFHIEQSSDGANWNSISKINSSGFSTSTLYYTINVENPEKIFNYYRLTEYDTNGGSSQSSIIAIDNTEKSNRKIIKVIDLLGRDVDIEYDGIKIIVYDDGTCTKVGNY